ncbi:MAG: cache domain-containing protein, partial [Motiliproteus sp.]|nr:cache domain-containing protein [Motiliproteus sp.]
MARKTVLMMSIRLSLVITLSALVSYFHIFGILNEQVRDSLQKYIAERGEKESAIFLHAERNHQKFKEEFLAQWPERQNSAPPPRFEDVFVNHESGGKRLHLDAFNGTLRSDGTQSQHITGYIGSNAPQNPRFYNKLLLSYDLIDRYAAAWTMDYANLYVSMPENVNLVYWPGVAWGNQAQSDLDVTVEEWVYVANQENNPDRSPAWTGLYFDATADEWMVSLATPVDHDDEHLINIGHDILLNTLFERVFNDKLAGTYNFIFREDGRIVAHPGLVEKLQQHKGVLNVEDAGNPSLLNTIKLITTRQPSDTGEISIIDDVKSDALLAVTRIDGPDWFFVTYYPKSLL